MGPGALRLLRLVLVLASFGATQADAHSADAHANGRSGGDGTADDAHVTQAARDTAARLFFSDRALVTQRGDEVAFYRDVVRDRVVLFQSMYTRCLDACPTQTARLAAVQQLLGDAVGRDVFFVSLTVDPEHDTPQVLADYARRFGAAAGWTFLTGSRRNVDDVLRRIGHLAPTLDAHTTLFLVGNARSGHWLRLHPDSSPADIARRLRALAAESAANGGSH
jgi:cytochrome oxidase Cu insertion factor (SCO1/SenC/PrrC family)